MEGRRQADQSSADKPEDSFHQTGAGFQPPHVSTPTTTPPVVDPLDEVDLTEPEENVTITENPGAAVLPVQQDNASDTLHTDQPALAKIHDAGKEDSGFCGWRTQVGIFLYSIFLFCREYFSYIGPFKDFNYYLFLLRVSFILYIID